MICKINKKSSEFYSLQINNQAIKQFPTKKKRRCKSPRQQLLLLLNRSGATAGKGRNYFHIKN